MAFIVPTVCRYTVHQTIGGFAAANIIDMHLDTTGSTFSREVAVSEEAKLILDAWHTRMLVSQVNDVQAQSVSWVDLNSEDGTTGSITATSSHTWPGTGSGVDDPLPGGVALLVQKQLAGSSRNRRNGRMYLCGPSEPFTASSGPNTLVAATATTIQGRLDSFLTDINQEFNIGSALDWTSKMVVVHITARDPDSGSPTEGTSTTVEALVLDTKVAFQRRRSGR